MLPSLSNLGCDTEAQKRRRADVPNRASRERRTPVLVNGQLEYHYRHAPLDNKSIRDALLLGESVPAVIAKYGQIAEWDVSEVENFSNLFRSRGDIRKFTADLSGWDVGNAKDMSYMFNGARIFTSDLSKWNVGNVKNMHAMFAEAWSFTSDLSKWDVGNVKEMSHMFDEAWSFTSDLSMWDVGNVGTMMSMFQVARSFTSDLSMWNVRNVKDMSYMFENARSFTSDLSMWNVGNVRYMETMFEGAWSFGPPLVWEKKAVWTEKSMRAHLDFVQNDETLQTYKSVRVRRRWRRLLWLFKEKKRYWTELEQKEIEKYEGGQKRYVRRAIRGDFQELRAELDALSKKMRGPRPTGRTRATPTALLSSR